MLVLGVTGVIFVVVASLLVYVIVKFRATAADADREPAQVYGSTQIELAWTIVPILIVIVLFASALPSSAARQDGAGSSQLVFSSTFSGDREIFTASADGSNRVDVTRGLPQAGPTPTGSAADGGAQ